MAVGINGTYLMLHVINGTVLDKAFILCAYENRLDDVFKMYKSHMYMYLENRQN